MIRGAIIFGVGFGFGYVHAVRNNEGVQEAARIFVQWLQDVKLEDDIRKKKEADAKAGATDSTAYDKIPDAEVVEPELEESETTS